MSHLSLRQVTKEFGAVRVLHGIDLDVRDGEFVVFVGPSGCGKSTLLRVIAGLESINLGEIRIGGRRVNDLAPAERGIASYVPARRAAHLPPVATLRGSSV